MNFALLPSARSKNAICTFEFDPTKTLELSAASRRRSIARR